VKARTNVAVCRFAKVMIQENSIETMKQESLLAFIQFQSLRFCSNVWFNSYISISCQARNSLSRRQGVQWTSWTFSTLLG